ncbi:hypothetical protein INR49_023105 [Caranx melampygus]|nr:hypothetical protein INR49_023105 [Caranx melampygus]
MSCLDISTDRATCGYDQKEELSGHWMDTCYTSILRITEEYVYSMSSSPPPYMSASFLKRGPHSLRQS